ncbi:hypothetical protein [Rathayibacter sp. VKM Ac-2857]|uniref:hypothetical protein n=1 Tax=Rathayibacter sp. VKM Ac-2857 TaxID=2739020 RepID=UPI0015679207|nr:hypothetical protein [Rathayibacter sp. VKM Ac-2857]NQX14343.1 hypothetical protein [Rathayibacter sp. VKM Ac-2857]
MTVQHEGAPLTRREIRERERAAAGAAPAAAPTTSRRAATASVTAAGEMPVLTATQALRVPVVAPTPAAEPELSTSAIEVVLPEGVDRSTLTRRELRALLAQQQAEQVAATPEVAPADAEQDAEPTTAAETSAPEQTDEVEPEQQIDESEQRADEPEQPLDEPEQPKLNTALFATVGTLDIADEKATEITGSFHPPIEHLAITDELDSKSKEEVDASFDSLIASGVAATGAVTTTNALILPTAGDASPVRTDTGEVLVTGSFDLPRSLGSTGQHPNLYDSPDVDRYVDRIDREQPASDSEPVRASSAVSTHAAGTAMIAPQKRRAVSVPVVLAITAAVLLVASIALFIGGFVLNIF